MCGCSGVECQSVYCVCGLHASKRVSPIAKNLLRVPSGAAHVSLRRLVEAIASPGEALVRSPLRLSIGLSLQGTRNYRGA